MELSRLHCPTTPRGTACFSYALLEEQMTQLFDANRSKQSTNITQPYLERQACKRVVSRGNVLQHQTLDHHHFLQDKSEQVWA